MSSSSPSLSPLMRYLIQMPKVELHLHLDGACRLSTLQDLARQYDLPYPYDNVEKFKTYVSLPSAVPSLVDFLRVFTSLAQILRTKEALERVAYEYVEDLSKANAVYAEIRYNPFSDVAGGPTGEEYVEAVTAGLLRGEQDFGVKVRSILVFKREDPERVADIVVLAKRYMRRGVVGVDIAGNELLTLDPRHIEGFKLAKEAGLHVTVHAGESGPAANVREAIEVLGAERIGHGYHVVDDDAVYQFAKQKKVHFEVCPTSSVFTNSASYANHPARRFAADGVSFSISTDDPGVMHCNLLGEYDTARLSLGMTLDQIKQSVINGAQAAFLPDQEKHLVLMKITNGFTQWNHLIGPIPPQHDEPHHDDHVRVDPIIHGIGSTISGQTYAQDLIPK